MAHKQQHFVVLLKESVQRVILISRYMFEEGAIACHQLPDALYKGIGEVLVKSSRSLAQFLLPHLRKAHSEMF